MWSNYGRGSPKLRNVLGKFQGVDLRADQYLPSSGHDQVYRHRLEQTQTGDWSYKLIQHFVSTRNSARNTKISLYICSYSSCGQKMFQAYSKHGDQCSKLLTLVLLNVSKNTFAFQKTTAKNNNPMKHL